MASGKSRTTRPKCYAESRSLGRWAARAQTIIAARSRCAKASHTSEGDSITHAIQPPRLHSLRDSKPFVKIISPVASQGAAAWQIRHASGRTACSHVTPPKAQAVPNLQARFACNTCGRRERLVAPTVFETMSELCRLRANGALRSQNTSVRCRPKILPSPLHPRRPALTFR
jgi:hypothetical protein